MRYMYAIATTDVIVQITWKKNTARGLLTTTLFVTMRKELNLFKQQAYIKFNNIISRLRVKGNIIFTYPK